MRARNGFTLIELIITIAIVATVANIFYTGYTDFVANSDSSDAYSTNATYVPPATPMCIEGYKALDGRQMVDSQGNGIPCG